MSDSKSLVDRADVINFGAVLALVLITVLIIAGLIFAWRQSDPWAAYKDVVIWANGVLLGILSTYGIIKRGEE